MKGVELDMHRSIDGLGKFSVSLKVDTVRNITSEDTCSLLDEIVLNVTNACFGKGADLIGHVKACAHNADDENRICTANLTSFRTGVKTNDMMSGAPFSGGYIMLHVVLHGLWDTQIRDISLSSIRETMDAHGLEYRIIRDFFEEG